jgi:cytochrome c2
MVSQSPRLSENQRPAHSCPERSGVMKAGQLWHRVCVIVLLVTIPDIARSGPSGLHVLADRQIQLVANPEKGALLFQQRCSMCHTTQEGGSPNISGPNLHGLFGRQAESLPEYNYSADLRASRIVWNALTLDAPRVLGQSLNRGNDVGFA